MKILIVDDDPATMKFMRLAFVAAGHAVSSASSVAEAIASATYEPPDVVLSDLAFGSALDGERDGCSLARTLRSLPATANVGLLAVSGAGSPAVLLDATNSGFDGFVSKPVDLRSLLQQVRHLGDLVVARRTGGASKDQA